MAVVGRKLSLALAIIPALEAIGLVDVGVDIYGRAESHTQGAAAKIADFDALERDNRVRRDIPALRVLAPDGAADPGVAAVDNRNFTFGMRLLRGLGDDLGEWPHLFDNTQHIDNGIRVDVFEAGEADKVEGYFWHTVVVALERRSSVNSPNTTQHGWTWGTNQLNFCVPTKSEFIVVVHVRPLLFGHLHATLRYIVDLALLKNFK
jgi:hypothetical protein